MLVIGDTDSGLPELPAAQAEAQDVARMFGAYGYQVRELLRPQAQRVLVHLFDERYFAIHLAGHGEVAGPGIAHTGLVLGPKTRLTAAQVGKLKRVPQFVFINCCHLGDMRPDAIAPWSKLAASLATAFIEMGSQAVIAAGWRIDDQAASIFAHSFYHAMLSGEYFGDAVRLAREAAYLQFPASNTWGAYQAYGDDRYRFPNTQSRPWQAPDYHYHGHLLADLETLHARLAGADAGRRASIEEKLGSIEEAVRARFFGCADIRENMAATRAGLGDWRTPCAPSNITGRRTARPTARWACARWRTGRNWRYARARPCAASMRAKASRCLPCPTRPRDASCCRMENSISTCWWRWRPRRSAWRCWDATGPCRRAWPAARETPARRPCAP